MATVVTAPAVPVSLPVAHLTPATTCSHDFLPGTTDVVVAEAVYTRGVPCTCVSGADVTRGCAFVTDGASLGV